MTVRSEVLALLAQTAEDHNKTLKPLVDDLPFLESGLDSLCLAVVVARLEDALGVDPFSVDEEAAFPVTVGDFIQFYEKGLAATRPDTCQPIKT